ncbi:MAG TPA: choice-of-anchor Q domain-containing protein [Rhodothermia bacterium]
MRSYALQLWLLILLSLSTSLATAQIVVNSLDDDGAAGDCELREAIINANNNDQSGSADCAAGQPSIVDEIDLTGLSGTIFLNGSPLEVTSNMDIVGPGSDVLAIDGDAQSRIFTIGGGALVSIKHLTMTNGRALVQSGDGDNGGGILNYGILTLQFVVITNNVATYGSGIMTSNSGLPSNSLNGRLNISLSEISFNYAPDSLVGNGGGINNNIGAKTSILASSIHNNRSSIGAAIYTLSKLTVVNSTISGNTSVGTGGGIYASTFSVPKDTLTIRHSTIAHNAALNAGGLFVSVVGGPDTANVDLYSSIIAGNTRQEGGSGPDIMGPITNSEGYNILGDNSNSSGLTHGVNGDQVGTGASPIDPMLFVLADNGGIGNTLTHLPMAGSPALDNGSCSLTSVPDDQRLFSRPLDHLGAEYPNADDGCDVGAVEVYELELAGGIEFVGFVLLEGPYNGAGVPSMSVALNSSLPEDQPFADASYNGTVLDYDGAESAVSVPPDAVDWALVSLRTGTGPETEVPGSEQPAFVTDSGLIVGLDGDTLEFAVPQAPYYLVVRHRNHMSVMTNGPVAGFASGLGEWDFTGAMSQAYATSGNPMKALSGGLFGMHAADGNFDGQITAPDFNLWNAATTAGATGYQPSDYNLDGQVTAPDFNLWNANTTAGASSKVPD